MRSAVSASRPTKPASRAACAASNRLSLCRHAERRERLDRFGEALDGVLAHVPQSEAVGDEPPGRRRDHDAARLGEALQPRGEIGRVADDRLLLRRAFAHETADDDKAGRDADANAELFARAGLQARHDFGDFERRVDRPRRVVLMRAGEAEIGENAVAHELRDEAVIARHHARDRVLIGADDLAHVLGVEPRRKRGRADEVAEHHGELPPLRCVGRDGGLSSAAPARLRPPQRTQRPAPRSPT